MNYAFVAIGTAVSLMLSAAMLNYWADPSSVYKDDAENADHYAAMLLKLRNGLWWPEGSVNERQFKLALAKQYRTTDCVLVGSSHVMQMSSHRPRRSLAAQCHSLINVGVSGAGIEDHILMAYTAIKNGRPRHIVLEISPWLFVFGKSQAWWEYQQEYYKARKAIFGAAHSSVSENRGGSTARLLNLINLEYTLRSLSKLSRETKQHEKMDLTSVPEIDDAIGGEERAFLPDGSFIPRKTTYRPDMSKISANWTYQTGGELIQPYAVDAYKAFIRWIRAQGVEPILLMTPYHENVWKFRDGPTTKALLVVEPVIRDIGKELSIQVIGSYDPKSIACRENEFLDEHHALTSCLIRIGQP